jgi:uncharacterized protein (DUF488 family)
MVQMKKVTIFTIGHSTHSIEEFIAMLKHNGITHLIDVRTIPKSRHNPQFNEDELHNSLKKVHIAYTHMKKLGGLRHAHKDSINTAWHTASFRGYADYMQTDEFQEGLKKLIEFAEKKNVAIMCAEAVPWRCHRNLIGDALLAKLIHVEDIFSLTSCKEHTMTPWAKVHRGNVSYPAE